MGGQQPLPLCKAVAVDTGWKTAHAVMDTYSLASTRSNLFQPAVLGAHLSQWAHLAVLWLTCHCRFQLVGAGELLGDTITCSPMHAWICSSYQTA